VRNGVILAVYTFSVIIAYIVLSDPAATLINGIAAFFVLRVFMAEIKPSVREVMEDMMVDTANLLAEIVEQDLRGGSMDSGNLREAFDAAHARKLEARIFDHLKQGVGIHAYLTDADGVVFFDSRNGRREGQNLRRMRDVSLTLAGHYGARSSRDDPDDSSTSVLYVAAPIGDPSAPQGVLTVYKPQLDVMPLVRERRRIIYTACGLIGGGILFLIGAVFLWLFQPIGKITEYARAVISRVSLIRHQSSCS
jgi:two-component system sensor histidine kinase CreC